MRKVSKYLHIVGLGSEGYTAATCRAHTKPPSHGIEELHENPTVINRPPLSKENIS
jgi:hypothetical protein